MLFVWHLDTGVLYDNYCLLSILQYRKSRFMIRESGGGANRYTANTQAGATRMLTVYTTSRPVANLTFLAEMNTQVVKYCNAIIIIDLAVESLRDNSLSTGNNYNQVHDYHSCDFQFLRQRSRHALL